MLSASPPRQSSTWAWRLAPLLRSHAWQIGAIVPLSVWLGLGGGFCQEDPDSACTGAEGGMVSTRFFGMRLSRRRWECGIRVAVGCWRGFRGGFLVRSRWSRIVSHRLFCPRSRLGDFAMQEKTDATRTRTHTHTHTRTDPKLGPRATAVEAELG
jgi:hypothetical protein